MDGDFEKLCRVVFLNSENMRRVPILFQIRPRDSIPHRDDSCRHRVGRDAYGDRPIPVKVVAEERLPIWRGVDDFRGLRGNAAQIGSCIIIVCGDMPIVPGLRRAGHYETAKDNHRRNFYDLKFQHLDRSKKTDSCKGSNTA